MPAWNVLLYALGGLLWLRLMHTRSLPLEGLDGIPNVMLAGWFYALVAVPFWGMVHGQARYAHGGAPAALITSAEAVLAVWTIGFVIAILWAADEHTPTIMFTAGVGLLLIVVCNEWAWLPWFEAAFGLYAWEALLSDHG